MSSDSDEPRIVVVPADPAIEASCEYARAAIDRRLVDDTEHLMTAEFDVAPELFAGIDFGSEPDATVASIWKQSGTTTGRTQSAHPNVSALPRNDIVDYLPLLVQSCAGDALDHKKLMEDIKKLSKDYPPEKDNDEPA